MAIRLGLDAKLYRNTGTIGSNLWSVVDNVRDVTLNLETGEADVTTRGNDGWRATVGTLKDAGIEFEMVWDTADAGFTAIKDAYFANTLIGLAAMVSIESRAPGCERRWGDENRAEKNCWRSSAVICR